MSADPVLMRLDARLGGIDGPVRSAALAAPARTHATAAGRGIVDVMLVVAVFLLFTLSGFALEFFGIPYESPTGSIVTKIHPSTYVLALALVLAVVANRDPVVYLATLLARRFGSTLLIIACVLLYLFISRGKPNESTSFLFDAMIAGGLISLLMADAGEAVRTRLSRLLHVVVAANSLIAIVEVSTGWRLFPFILGGIGGQEQVWDYRATALFGHPLIGALTTGVYAIILMTVHNVRGLSPRLRLPMILLAFAALPALGARTSFVVVSAVAAAMIGLHVLRFLMGGRVSSRLLVNVALAVLLVAAVTAAAAGFAHLGFFDAFVDRFLNDKGSAETRLTMFRLLNGFGLSEFLSGYDPIDLATQIRREGLTQGVESSWMGHLLRYGVPMALVLWTGIAAWFIEIRATTGRGATIPLVLVFLVISTSVGISAKTTMLTLPTVLLLALVAPAPGDRRRPTER